MTAEIRVWRIQKGNHLNPVKSSKLDMEARLEDWIEVRWTDYFKMDLENVGAILPQNKQKKKNWSAAGEPEWAGFEGYFQTDEEVKRFVTGLQKAQATG